MLLILTAFLAQRNIAQEKTFGYVKIGGGGYVCSVIESLSEQNVFYAKSDVGGIYKWNETTKDWTPLFAWVSPDETTYMGTEAFVIDPGSPNKLFAMAGTNYWNNGKSALLRSFDYGKTWEVYETTSKFKVDGNGLDRQKGETLAIDPANGNILYFGTRNSNGLFKSTDAGKTWNKVTTFPDSIGTAASFSFVLFDKDSATPEGCSTIIVGNHKTGNNLFISEDFGATWTSIGGFSKAKPQRCVLSPNDRNLYVTYANGDSADGYGGVYKYNMTTKQWTNISPATNRGYSGISLILNDPQKITCSTYNFWGSQQPWGWGDEIYYSATGGSTGLWVRKNSSTGSTMLTNGINWMQNHSMHWVGCVTMSNTKPGVVYAVSGNGVFMTDNIMASKPAWKVVSHGLEETVPCFQGMLSIPNGPLITAIGDVNGFVHTDIDQYPTASITQSVSMAYAPQNTSTIVRSVNKQKELSPGQFEYWNVVALSENNGSTWTELPVLPVKIAGGKASISADGKIILWQANNTATGNVLYWTDNKGVTWNKTATMPANAVPVPDGVDPLKFYLYNTTGKIYRSDDGAKTFNPISNVGSAGGSSVLKTIPGKAGHVWINNNGKIRYSTNEGVTFTTCNNYSCAAFSLGKEAPGNDYPTVYIWGKSLGSSPEGMCRSVDMGKTWIRANDDEHEWGHLANAGNIEADQNVYGRVYKSTAGMGIPWMGINTGTGVSANYADKNSIIGPNPFENSITLRANGVNIKSIDIYNLQGMQIQHIETDMYANESIDFGDDLISGVYLVNVRDTKCSQQYKIIKQ
ncbi:VPS10 domain-containing protein [Parabacteroides sp. FAFU027]|uniref:VPS10 domain-containing protein n=1 Tax=Parabacteroides sp. FAFU027 TaxID=2922715 RepID=UPI001FB021B5|nr:T9SS type A sorting domain-containing protein [Parabacteroides sp. FAFU027]